MTFDTPPHPTMADCPIFQAHRDAEFDRIQAKALATCDLGDCGDGDGRAEHLYRLGLDGRHQDRTAVTVWSGR